MVFDPLSRIAATAQQEFTQIFPEPGRVEHDANEILHSQIRVAREAIEACDNGLQRIAAIGITNQRETTIVWERESGRPVANAIVWQDRRTTDICEQLSRGPAADIIRRKTGLIVDPYFSATKLRWLLDHIDNGQARAEAGDLAFGTVDSWLIYNLTAHRLHITDFSNASRTLLFNIHSGEWDSELLSMLDIPRCILPELRPSSDIYGETDPSVFGRPIPLGGIAGDQQAALFGQMCTQPGLVKTTYGTGCFMLMNTGNTPVESENRLLTTIAWKIGDSISYALEGSVYMGGALVQWLRDNFGLIESAQAIESLAASVVDCNGVTLVPAFTGLGAPYWDPHACGLLCGLTRGTERGHIARAALEAIAHQVADLAEAMERDAGLALSEMRVDGGASANNLLMQFQADLLNRPLQRPQNAETTALGAAGLAGLAAGVWRNPGELNAQWQIDRRFNPGMDRQQIEQRRERWKNAVAAARQLG